MRLELARGAMEMVNKVLCLVKFQSNESFFVFGNSVLVVFFLRLHKLYPFKPIPNQSGHVTFS